ncbi:MAG: xanthine dehydrogenase accessory protein XdhC [Polaromonas sp.]|uniref:xanthine dehydrogenase accessory protein XdhC n=1 Tax=Polaromonas sp. TaxID=1869339 RepID=UPI002734ECF4|nr:xanthine dehydrogenase accessory protein XdhC [Polaromonas sp.]MDP2816963.1 xanthine dehydrogenase accessory protein XdhC [Polaromonas sp.]
MNQIKERFLERLAREPAVLVHVAATEGSVPREAGTWMAVFPDALVGTIGGGHLEYQAVASARARLAGAVGPELQRVVLGPSLGQCCGGVVQLRFESVDGAHVKRLEQALTGQLQPVALFGGGHVGHALVRVLSNLPFALTWIDSRDGIFPEAVPKQVVCEYSDPVQRAVPRLAPGSHVLIMSFSHAEDLDIVAECLKRQREKGDLPYIGLIGSKTKWASFRQRLAARGFSDKELAYVTCPIGLPGIKGKEPEVIAVAVAAQLLQGTPK